MSKLNDSTLKILKKYRLDTDMSVFGNENKLYDVVKVMDDMVGNQVSKLASTSFSITSSTNTTSVYCVRPSSNGKATYTGYTSSKTTMIANNFTNYYYDSLSMKFLLKSSEVVYIGCLRDYNQNNKAVYYCGYKDGMFRLYDETMVNEISGDVDWSNTKYWIDIIVCISDTKQFFNGVENIRLSQFFGGTEDYYEYNVTAPNSVIPNIPLTVPESFANYTNGYYCQYAVQPGRAFRPYNYNLQPLILREV